MSNQLKSFIIKLLPLIVLYLLFVVMFLGKSEYEYIIALTASIPLIVFIFNKDPKVERILKYTLYLFLAALIIYVIDLFRMDYHWFGFCQRNFYAETNWSILKWNQFFLDDLKYLIYIGIIFLTVRGKKL